MATLVVLAAAGRAVAQEGSAPPPKVEEPTATPLVVPVPAATASPAPDGQARKIVDIRLAGATTLSRDTALYYLELRPGDPYSEQSVRAGFRKLWDSGLLNDLRIDSEEAPGGGVVLVLTVSEKVRITTVEYRGNRKVSNSQVKDKLKEAKAEIKDGSFFSYGLANRVKAAISELYESQGYKAAIVDWKIENPAKPESRLIFEIDEGDKTKIERINFTGTTIVPTWWLRFKMSKLTETAWWNFWTSADVYNRPAYDEDAATIRQVYQEQGYKDVQVGDPVVEYENVDVTPFWSSKKQIERRVVLTIPVKEGERFYFGKIKVEGSKLIPEERLVELFPCPEGSVLKRSLFDEGLQNLEKVYRERGYIYVYANPDFADREDRKVDITVKLAEGDQYRLGRVEFTGNKDTRDKVLRRELRIAEGDVMDMEAFKTSMFKIQQLGFFKLADDPVDFHPDQDKKTVEITVKGEEVGRNDIQLAGGYSEIDGFFGQFQFNTRNLLGNGETFGLSYQRGKNRTFFELGYTNPWFMDKRNVLGMSVFNRITNYTDVYQESKGGSLLFGVGLRDFENVSAFYSYERINATYQTLNPGGGGGGGGGTGGDDGGGGGVAGFGLGLDGIPINDGPSVEHVVGVTSSITPGYRYDSRNDPFDPSVGTRFSFSAQIAGPMFGGTYSFVKPEIHYTIYRPLSRILTGAFNAEGGWVVPYGGQDIPIFERYRLGGERNIRGFAYGSILPKKDNGMYYFDEHGARLGGAKYLVFNAESIFQVAGPLKFVLFADAGNTWFETQGATLAKLRTSAGAEVRIFVPIFQAPLRFIYAVNLNPQFGEHKNDFTFTIGTNF